MCVFPFLINGLSHAFGSIPPPTSCAQSIKSTQNQDFITESSDQVRLLLGILFRRLRKGGFISTFLQLRAATHTKQGTRFHFNELLSIAHGVSLFYSCQHSDSVQWDQIPSKEYFIFCFILTSLSFRWIQ